ncbi:MULTISPECIES: hypothetical protein [unclassified Bradyrhizobium]|nr:MULTISPECIES: hypothetical protein [unclassified Bradyrhizobium]
MTSLPIADRSENLGGTTENQHRRLQEQRSELMPELVAAKA